MSAPVIVFDLVGTLLDLSSLDHLFQSEFGSADYRREWFEEALKIAFSTTAADRYEPFADMTQAALKVIEERLHHRLSWLQRRRILSSVREMPAFPDVERGLKILADDGFRLSVLTNSSTKLATHALESGGLTRYFDEVFSSDSAKRLKPAREPYLWVAKKLRQKPQNLTMVAAHAWDIAGAHEAGLQTCFVRRPGQVLNELTPKPALIVNDIVDLAIKLTGSAVGAA